MHHTCCHVWLMLCRLLMHLAVVKAGIDKSHPAEQVHGKAASQRACAALGDEPAAPQAPLRSSLPHDGQRDAVLDAAARVQELRLAQDLRAVQGQGLLADWQVQACIVKSLVLWTHKASCTSTNRGMINSHTHTYTGRNRQERPACKQTVRCISCSLATHVFSSRAHSRKSCSNKKHMPRSP